MKVAFFSDIHANFPAVCEALNVASRQGATSVVVAGDMIGSGPHPVEVMRLLQERGVQAIRGNVDNAVLAIRKSKKLRKKLAKKKSRAHLAWTAAQLGENELKWLTALPAELRLEYHGLRVRVVHGTPQSDEDYLYPSITAEGLRAMLGEDQPEVLVAGHSHIPFAKVVAGVRVINCGSVGRPVDGDPRGSFVLADFTDPKNWHCHIVRFTYPVSDLVADIEARKVPGAEGSDFLLGVKIRGV